MKDNVTEERRAIQVRLPVDLHERLTIAARERVLSVNFLTTRAIEDFLDRLIPVEELRYTRERSEDQG